MTKSNVGDVTRETDGYQVKFERILEHDILTVWEALTNPAKLKAWFTDIEMEFRPGGKITFQFRDESRTRTYGEIVTIRKPDRFAFTWEGELAVWDLSEPAKGKCRLTLTYSRLSDEFAVGASAGFHTLLDRLERTLDGDAASYPFGTEEYDPEQVEMRAEYGKAVFGKFPGLKRFEPIHLERTFDASVERVWKAITDKDHMSEWYFDLESFKPEPGFEFSFYGQGRKGERYLHLCKVTEVVPLRKLTYSWRYEGYPGNSFVSFELFPDGDRTRLRLTHKGLGTFPAGNPDLAPESFHQGWTELINVSLNDFLSKLKQGT